MKILFRMLSNTGRIVQNIHAKRHDSLKVLSYKNNSSTFKQSVQFFCSKSESTTQEICNVGTIGHVDHGKTTLTSAITKYIAEENKSCKYISFDEIDKAPEEKKRGITINIAHVGYATKKRRYAHTDCPGHADFIKNMLSGASQMEGAILVVAADDGPMPQTKEHLLLIQQIGIKHVVVYINKADISDLEIMELIQIEVMELLNTYGFNSANTPFIHGSARLALNGDKSKYGTPSIKLLLDALDNHIPTPERDYTSPFVLPISNVLSVRGRGTVVIGTLKQGIIKQHMAANLLGFDEVQQTVITNIQLFQKSVPEAVAGDNIGVLLRGIKFPSVRRGMIVCQKKYLQLSNHFEAQLYLLRKDEGGRRLPLQPSGYCTNIHCSTWNIYCRFDFILPPESQILMPGEFTKTRMTLRCCMPVIKGQVFTVRENNSTIGTGQITRILKAMEFDKKKMNEIKINFNE